MIARLRAVTCEIGLSVSSCLALNRTKPIQMYCDSDYVTDARLDAVYCVTIYGDENISVNAALGWCSPLLQGIFFITLVQLKKP